MKPSMKASMDGGDSIYFLICRTTCRMFCWRCEKERRERAEVREDISNLGGVNNRTVPLRKATMRYNVSRKNCISALRQWRSYKGNALGIIFAQAFL